MCEGQRRCYRSDPSVPARWARALRSSTRLLEQITPQDYTHHEGSGYAVQLAYRRYTDLFDQAETSIDKRAELALSNAMALGRAEDQLIIDALDAASSLAGTVDEDLGGTNSPINAEKLRRAKRYLLQQQVIGADHTMLINAAGLEGALAETEITSADQTMRALVDADLNNRRRSFYRALFWKIVSKAACRQSPPTSSSALRSTAARLASQRLSSPPPG